MKLNKRKPFPGLCFSFQSIELFRPVFVRDHLDGPALHASDFSQTNVIHQNDRAFRSRSPSIKTASPSTPPSPYPPIGGIGWSICVGKRFRNAKATPGSRYCEAKPARGYITRPALCLERLSQRPDGRVQWQLKRPFRDGTTHFVFTPEDFIARLAALVPRPQHNLTRYHGVFAPSAALRSQITPAGRGGSAGQRRRRKRRKAPAPTTANPPDQTSPEQLTAPLTWATRRVTDHSSASST